MDVSDDPGDFFVHFKRRLGERIFPDLRSRETGFFKLINAFLILGAREGNLMDDIATGYMDHRLRRPLDALLTISDECLKAAAFSFFILFAR